jgi:selenophosphate synthase
MERDPISTASGSRQATPGLPPPGDALVLTKAVGTGMGSTAREKGDLHGATDIAGYGLIGRGVEMARAAELPGVVVGRVEEGDRIR